MQSSANPQQKKPEAELLIINRFSITICPYAYFARDLDVIKGQQLQKELIENLTKCGLRPGIDFTYTQPNSIEMIKYEGLKSLLGQYSVTFGNTAAVLNALKVLPANFILHTANPIDFDAARMECAMSHSDNEAILPVDLKMVMELHERSYRELQARVLAAIQTNAGTMHPALVNFQAAIKFIDEKIKNDPYLVEASQYSMLVLALWYVVQELANVEPEVKKGFMATFRKVSADISPVNQQYKKLFEEYVRRIPAKFTDKTQSSAETLKALYMEKIGLHINAVVPVANKGKK